MKITSAFKIGFLVICLTFVASKMFLEDDSVNDVQQYDFYVFSLGWSDTYCRHEHEESKERCFEDLHNLKVHNILRIHGLWPSLLNHKMMDDCNKGKHINIPKSSEYPFNYMAEHWPSLGHFNTQSFWEHEYNKHGYCYTQKNKQTSYIPYFTQAVEVYQKENFATLITDSFPELKKNNSVTYVELTDKLSKHKGSNFFDLICTPIKGEGQHLSEIRFYYDLDFKRKNDFTYHTNCDKTKPLIFHTDKV